MEERTWIGVRYVDNLLLLSVGPNSLDSYPKWLRGIGNYGDTVLLEYEAHPEYLGMVLEPRGDNFHIGVLVPGFEEVLQENGTIRVDRWRYRSFQAASSRTMAMSGAITRLHLAAKLAYPPVQAQIATAKLIAILSCMGFPNSSIMKAVSKLARKFPQVYTTVFLGTAKEALSVEKADTLFKLRGLIGRLRFM